MSLFPKKEIEVIRPEGMLKYLGILFVVLLVTYSYQEIRKWVKRNMKNNLLVEEVNKEGPGF
ncbi:hypothetical protein KMI_04g06240 [Encephalitozoon hellem]|uniref:Uncharacterized protein n=1 Tax=Encephalitozoon hellem TaxID=27973 RepID=A0A9Q9C2J6_ENCHE|nr:hypothetical protein KMI_04g06240 [Encephalitozoon hellem]UTX42896.1 hypothetical protein GPU96_04g06240 [Encephalitozoon hellem]WEL38353.1 hypothetical protein PFJ87_04g00220 [Encephalitozoon hellem]